MRLLVRYCLAAACIVAAALFAVLSWGPLHNLFEDYKDSPVAIYLILGLPFLVISAAFLMGAVFLVWPHRRR
jgi:hypothetical protein